MDKNKSKKIFYGLLALGLIFLNFPSIAHAWGDRRRVTYRPISDWTELNPRVVYGFTTNWDLLPEGYLVIPRISPDQYTGYIREKVLDDGSAELTVIVYVKGCSVEVYGLDDAFNGIFEVLLEDTKYYCIYKIQFILPGPNQDIPIFWDILDAGQWLSTFSIGFGTGTFTDYAETSFGFTSGETGLVYLHQKGYTTPEGGEIWPYETIELYEIG